MSIDRTQTSTFRRSGTDALERASNLRFLFNGRKDITSDAAPLISIGRLGDADNSLTVGLLLPYDLNYINTSSSGFVDIAEVAGNSVLRLSVEVSNAFAYQFPLDKDYRPGIIRALPGVSKLIYVFLSASGSELNETGAFWDNVVLTELEKDVLKSLQLIAPEVEAVNMAGNEGSNGERIAKVRLTGVDEPISLRGMGEGMNRMFGIALALVNAKDGMLLIDEVDTGLHYSVLPEMWKLIFEVAHRLNVQVFATSHSWDCIQAFQEAAAENKEADGVLIRLEQRKDGIGAVTFDEQELAIVTREQIEVR